MMRFSLSTARHDSGTDGAAKFNSKLYRTVTAVQVGSSALLHQSLTGVSVRCRFSLFFPSFLSRHVVKALHLLLKELYVLSKICRPEEAQVKKNQKKNLVAVCPNTLT